LERCEVLQPATSVSASAATARVLRVRPSDIVSLPTSRLGRSLASPDSPHNRGLVARARGGRCRFPLPAARLQARARLGSDCGMEDTAPATAPHSSGGRATAAAPLSPGLYLVATPIGN